MAMAMTMSVSTMTTSTTTSPTMTTATSNTGSTCTAAKSLLLETMGDSSAKQYEYLFDDDDDDGDDGDDGNDDNYHQQSQQYQMEIEEEEHDDGNYDDEITNCTMTHHHDTNTIIQQLEEQLQTTQQQLKQRDTAIQSTLELCQTLELKLDQMSHQFVGKNQFQALQQQYHSQQQELQLQQQETKVVIMELMNQLQIADQTNQQLQQELAQLTQQEQYHDELTQNEINVDTHVDTDTDIDTHVDVDTDTDIDTHAVIQAGIDLADSLIELLLEGNEQSEVSILEQMEALDQLLANDDEDDDFQYKMNREDDKGQYVEQNISPESSYCLLGEQIEEVESLTVFETKGNEDNNNNENMIWRLYQQVQQLEYEQSLFLQESLDMLQATRAASEIELQVKLAEMQEETNRTIQLRVMEELQKHRILTVVDEDDLESEESKSTM